MESKKNNIIIYTDGACRGNHTNSDGHTSSAFIVYTVNEQQTLSLLTSQKRYLGLGTNNQAEYRAIVAALS